VSRQAKSESVVERLIVRRESVLFPLVEAVSVKDSFGREAALLAFVSKDWNPFQELIDLTTLTL
jgi:hypothetical protein